MLSSQSSVRAARAEDVPALIVQMRALAAFEGYLDDFRVDEQALLARALGDRPECQIFVAEGAQGIAGYAVGLTIDFTYDLRPTAVLKELFVAEGYRGNGYGTDLLRQVTAWALAKGAVRLKWDVLTGNHRAEAFYRQHGGHPDAKWIPYGMGELALRAIALPDGEPSQREASHGSAGITQNFVNQ